jgi:hypothetical protein
MVNGAVKMRKANIAFRTFTAPYDFERRTS